MAYNSTHCSFETVVANVKGKSHLDAETSAYAVLQINQPVKNRVVKLKGKVNTGANRNVMP